MKTNFASGSIKCAALMVACLLAASASVSHAAPAFPKSPVFSNAVPAWDCIITGAKGERGIGLLTFSYAPDGYGNYSFFLQEIHTKVPTSTASVPVTTTNTPSTGRGGSSPNRGDTSGTIDVSTNLNTTSSTTAGTNIFGYMTTSGSWGYDYKGNVLGFFIELVVDSVSGTNITYITNRVSFIGKVTPNKRFTALYSSTIGGNGKFSGIPQKPVINQVNGSDFSGPWTGNEIGGGVNSVELFSLYASGFTNSYDITGDGPGYTLDWQPYGMGPFTSKCIVSCQKKIAFTDYKFINSTNPVYYLRATFGNLKNTSKVLGSNTKGLLSSDEGYKGSNIVYNAYFVPFVPYP